MRRDVVHLELHTADRRAAGAFYAQLLGWQSNDVESPSGTYRTLDLSVVIGGGIVECGTQRSLWLPYVEVDDVRRSTQLAQELGAEVTLEPREGPAGLRSVVSAPAGGEIALWQAKELR